MFLALKNGFDVIFQIFGRSNRSNGIPSVKNMLFGRPAKCDVFVERIPLDDVPEDAEKAADWLHECFRQKVLMGYAMCRI
jgi:Acyltransferase C-terminus